MTTLPETDENASVRASGSTPAVEEAHEVAAALGLTLDESSVGEAVENEPSRIPRFERLRFNYFDPVERQVLMEAHSEITRIMVREFTDAYLIIDEIKHIVRIPILDDEGEVRHDENGEPMWESSRAGGLSRTTPGLPASSKSRCSARSRPTFSPGSSAPR